jgi:hypothetical protein
VVTYDTACPHSYTQSVRKEKTKRAEDRRKRKARKKPFNKEVQRSDV